MGALNSQIQATFLTPAQKEREFGTLPRPAPDTQVKTEEPKSIQIKSAVRRGSGADKR